MTEFSDDDLRDLEVLAARVNGFVYHGDRLNALVQTVEALRADPDLAARLIMPGGKTRQEYASVRPRWSSQDYTLRSTPEAALHTAKVWGPGARAVTRFTTDWPDGSRYTTPWKEIQADGPTSQR
jgi:hypothetical protein